MFKIATKARVRLQSAEARMGAPTLAAACGLAILPAFGPHVLADEQRAQLEEIVVTATRTGAANLQDIPMSISALAPDKLASQGLNSLGDTLRAVPGVVLNAEQQGYNRITMRGLVASDMDYTQVQDRSLVGMYLDEIPIGLGTHNPDLRVLDMERIEVIRGPQGTLYGAGSMGGTVRYITRKPDPSKFAATVETQGSYTKGGGPNWNAKASANMPLVADELALRLGVYRESLEGYVDNLGTGKENANNIDNTQANAALRWMPSEDLTIDASVIYQKPESDGTNGYFREKDDSYSSLRDVGFEDDLRIYNLTLDYDLGSMSLLSSTSYIDRDFDLLVSLDALVTYFLGINSQPTDNPRMPGPSSQRNTIENFTQEIRLVSEPGRLQWQIGAYYADDERRYVQHSIGEGSDALLGASAIDDFLATRPDEIYYGDIQAEDKQWALFGEATYELTETIAVTVGLRYFDFEGPASYYQSGVFGLDADGGPLDGEAVEKSSGTNPKVAITYAPNEDLLFYAEAAKGFRYGGVNYPVPTGYCGASLAAEGLTDAPKTFGPDEVWSYSLGEKGTFADGRMTVNVAAFLIKWSDAQTIHPLACGYPFIENGGKIESKGVEVESRINLTDAFRIGINASYTSSESDGGIPTIEARDGDAVPYFPEWSVAVSADYTLDFASGELILTADYSFRDEMGTEFNPNLSIYREIPSSSVLNAAANYTTGQWQFGLYGTNLTDNRQLSSVAYQTYPATFGDLYFLGRPRTVGLRVQRAF